MIRSFLYILLVITFSFLLPSVSQARTIKKHAKAAVVQSPFQDRGVFVWNEIRFNGNDYGPYVQKAKVNGIRFVIVKAFDGCQWGVRNRSGYFQTQLNEQMIAAFHKAGIKCYGYGTAWLKPQSEVGETARHAINVLHKTSADGLVFDDVFAYGSDRKQTERLFSTVRKHINTCKVCREKTLAFSTFPSVWRTDVPWGIPLRYCDYYLPQIYWNDMRTTPTEAVSRFQRSWIAYRSNHKGIRCKIVPVASTVGSRPGQITQFVSACKSHGYGNLAFFRWDGTSRSEWVAITKKVRK